MLFQGVRVEHILNSSKIDMNNENSIELQNRALFIR